MGSPRLPAPLAVNMFISNMQTCQNRHTHSRGDPGSDSTGAVSHTRLPVETKAGGEAEAAGQRAQSWAWQPAGQTAHVRHGLAVTCLLPVSVPMHTWPREAVAMTHVLRPQPPPWEV